MSITNDPRPPLALDRGRRPYRMIRLLRWVPGPLLLACIVGGVLMIVGAVIDDRERRTDSFTVLSEDRHATQVVRLDLPPGWRIESRPRRAGYSTALFTPDGKFAFQVLRETPVYDKVQRRWRSYESMAEFVRQKEAQGYEVERRPAADGGEVGVARKTVPDTWTKQWGVGGRGADAVRTTYYSPASAETCLSFVTRAGDADRLKPTAFRLFQGARLLRRGDPAADDTVSSPESTLL